MRRAMSELESDTRRRFGEGRAALPSVPLASHRAEQQLRELWPHELRRRPFPARQELPDLRPRGQNPRLDTVRACALARGVAACPTPEGVVEGEWLNAQLLGRKRLEDPVCGE